MRYLYNSIHRYMYKKYGLLGDTYFLIAEGFM